MDSRLFPDTLAILPVGDSLPFAELVWREIKALESAVSPAEWLKDHPRDAVRRFDPGDEVWDPFDQEPYYGPWCLRARRRLPLPEDSAALRSAYFYPPPMPDPPILPSVRDSLGADLSECQLGAIWIEAAVEGLDQAQVVMIRQHLADRLGPSIPVEAFNHYVAAEWTEPSFWHEAGTSHLVVVDHWSHDADSVRVGVWRDFSGIPVGPLDPQALEYEVGIPQLRQAIRTADLDSVAGERLLDLAVQGHAFRRSLPRKEILSPAEFFGILRPWIERHRRVPARQRAAALLLADRALFLYPIDVDPEVPGGDRNRALLDSLGAGFERTYDFHYTGNWLDEAYRLDRGGPIGELAFLFLAQRGFQTSPFCEDHGGDDFRAVIDEGIAFLERNGLAADLAARIHLEVARAYGDIVAIASETTSPAIYYRDADAFKAEAPLARRNALKHYGRALQVLAPTVEGEAIWREAWRLASGLPPLKTRFLCIWD
ncbi:MAG: hypothetical protein ACREK7_00495 [Gemmatimonadota bacterium]